MLSKQQPASVKDILINQSIIHYKFDIAPRQEVTSEAKSIKTAEHNPPPESPEYSSPLRHVPWSEQSIDRGTHAYNSNHREEMLGSTGLKLNCQFLRPSQHAL